MTSFSDLNNRMNTISDEMTEHSLGLVERLAEGLGASGPPVCHASVGNLTYSLERGGLELVEAGMIGRLCETLGNLRAALSEAEDAYRFSGTISIIDATLAKHSPQNQDTGELPVSIQNITPTCRQTRGDMGALEEALLRIERAYLTYKDSPNNDRVTWRVSLVRVEDDGL